MGSLLIKEDKIIWFALIASLLIHGLVFVFSGRTFIQHAQFSIRPSAQMVEVSIVSSSVIASEAKQSFNFKEIASSASPPRNDTYLAPLKGTGNIAQQSKAVVQSQSGVTTKASPDYFQNPPPSYPELARQMRQEGLVMLAVDVDREGIAIKVEILKSSGSHLLDQAALKAIRNWKFRPGNIGGIPVDFSVTVPIRFRLEK